MNLAKNNIKTSEEATAFLTECAIATIEKLAMTKKMAEREFKREFKRQIDIAQVGVNIIRQIEFETSGKGLPRLDKLVKGPLNVEEYAMKERGKWEEIWNKNDF